MNWVKSDQGLKSYEKYINFNAYVYETKCQAIQKTRRDSFRAAYGVDYTLDFVAENPIPYIYFKALVDAVRSEYMPQALYVADVREWLISLLETIAKPFRINEDGEPEVCAPMFDPPADLVSVDKNPLLKFVSKFDCFDLESSETGTMEEKFKIYQTIIIYLCGRYTEDNMWIFDKNTYFNDFGVIKKEKAFLKKCKELVSKEEDIAFFDQRLANCE